MQNKTIKISPEVRKKLAELSKKMNNAKTKTLPKYKNMLKEYSKQDKEFSDVQDLAGSFYVGRIILWTCAVFVITMLVWAYFSDLDEVVKTQGQVIPSSKGQLIQSLEGGIVEEILVKEGEEVTDGQVLVKMDDIHFSSNLQEGEVKEYSYKIKILRIESELNNTPFVVPKDLAEKFPDLVIGEEELHVSHQKELDSLHGMKKLLERELEMTMPLIAGGAVSEVDVLRLKQRLREIEINISKFRSNLLRELNTARMEKDRLHANNASLRDRLSRTELRSPVDGKVKQIYVATIGGVVNPGVPILEIVPIEDSLLVEARVSPKDIGFLRLGQKSMVKVSAYDFSIYGSLDGEVVHISADTSTDPRGVSFYEIWVRTDKNYIVYGEEKLQIMPGMQVQADITTGHKSVLSYLLKPILKTKQQALRER